MSDIDNNQLAVNLARAESENEVISLLQQYGYWNSPSNWRYFGDVENNYSTIGNQQSAADAALVEKLVNSIDSVLIKNCIKRNIDPEGPSAPQTINRALEEFFSVRGGDISNLDTRTRNNLSHEIILAATGTAQKPNYVIADSGEGQTPKTMPETILSIGKSNKLKIPFVQGKYNMGGTGVFRFCSPDYNMQIIICKKCPEIIDKSDITSDRWGVTVIRREAATSGRKSSIYTYLTDKNHNILSFKSDSIKIVPSTDGTYNNFKYGMYIKLINYNLSGYKTNILFDLNYRLALLMPQMAYPIRLIECRKAYRGHSFEATLSGLAVRLKDNRTDNIEPGFPSSFQLRCLDQDFSGSVYVFKKDAKVSDYKKNEGIIFVINGQTHASLSKSFFKRKGMGLSYLADSILVIVDCSMLGIKEREDLFMNSRDRLCQCELKKELENKLEEYIKSHEGLKILESDRRREIITNEISDERPLVQVLNKILTKSPTLSKLFIQGEQLKSPYNLNNAGLVENFVGKIHPTFFNLKTRFNMNGEKLFPINHNYRIQFVTDVQNDYFSRENECGKLEIYCNGARNENLKNHLGLFNGIVTLTLSFPMDAKPGDKFKFSIHLIDEWIAQDFIMDFTIVADKPRNYNTKSSSGDRQLGVNNNNLGNKTGPGSLALPIIQEFDNRLWSQLNANKDTALIIKENENGVYDFFINMENVCLLNELKNIHDVLKNNLLKTQFKYSMVLIGISAINHFIQISKEENAGADIESKTSIITSIMAPIILPIINSLSEINETDIISTEDLPA